MEIKLGILIESNKVLNILNQKRGFSGVTAYRIMKNVKAISTELADYEKQRINLCEKYANKGEDGNPVINEEQKYDISNENMKVLRDELEKLHAEAVDVPIKKISLEEINVAELSPAMIEKIEFMIIELDD